MRKRYAIDIEASGFWGYPIELGWAGIDHDDVQSCLIRPTEEWLSEMPWDDISEGIHAISLDEIQRDGLDPREVVEMFLGNIGENPVLFSDAVAFDQKWLDLLFEAAGFDRAPILTPARSLPPGDSIHRAGPDALALARHLSLFRP